MGRPAEARNAEADADASSRTDEIRLIAAQLFEQSGYSSTTMSDIATAVGVLPGSLYHHFESKEEIALEIVAEFNRQRTDLARTLTASLNDSDPDAARGQLVDIATAVTSLSLQNKAALRLIAYAGPSSSTERFRAALGVKEPSLEQLWERAVHLLIPDPDATQDTENLVTALHQLTISAVVNSPDTRDAGQLAHLQTSMLLDGLLMDPSSDEELDASDAIRAAREAIASWGKSASSGEPNSREHIVASARAEFARRGFDATTVRDIATAAEVRMGTLYRRVGSKEEILTEIIEAYNSKIDGAVRSVLSASTSEASTLDALALLFVHAKHRFALESEIVKLGWPLGHATIPAIDAYEASTRERTQLVADVIARGTQTGTIRPLGAPAEMVPQFRFIIWVPYPNRTRADRERAHRFLRNSLLRGLLRTS